MLVNFRMGITYRALLTAAVLTVAVSSAEGTANWGTASAAGVKPQSASAAVEKAAPQNAVKLTVSQKNAVRSAKQYLSMTGFSRAGLINQLSSSAGEGYDIADATVAVDSLDVDWNANAVRSAKQYLRMTGFSCKGLIQQLSSSAGDKYTESEATFGAQQAGVCP